MQVGGNRFSAWIFLGIRLPEAFTVAYFWSIEPAMWTYDDKRHRSNVERQMDALGCNTGCDISQSNTVNINVAHFLANGKFTCSSVFPPAFCHA